MSGTVKINIIHMLSLFLNCFSIKTVSYLEPILVAKKLNEKAENSYNTVNYFIEFFDELQTIYVLVCETVVSYYCSKQKLAGIAVTVSLAVRDRDFVCAWHIQLNANYSVTSGSIVLKTCELNG